MTAPPTATDLPADSAPAPAGAWQVFLVFLRLGLTSFGGPVAHLAYFRDEFVLRRRWLDERNYADLVALCQFLPGPASSQVGMALGLMRAGYRGAFAAWAGFTLPSAIILVVLALRLAGQDCGSWAGALRGLGLAAVSVVAHAVWGMARTLCPDLPRIVIMLGAACVALLAPHPLAQLALIAGAGLAGLALCRPASHAHRPALPLAIGRRAGAAWLLIFLILLAGLPLLAAALAQPAIAIGAAFYRAGALVFGGGHVVLPLLQAATVTPEWIDLQNFLAGYALAQAVPGPLFTFAAFLGAAMQAGPGGWVGALVCLLAIFAPSFLLVAGALPFWDALRRSARAQAALMGVNAAVVGLLLAALCQSAGAHALQAWQDAVLVLAAFAVLVLLRWPAWLVVAGCALAGWLVY